MNFQQGKLPPWRRSDGTEKPSLSPESDPPSSASANNPGHFSEDPLQFSRVASPYANVSLGSTITPYGYPSINGSVGPCPECMIFSCELRNIRNSMRELNVKLVEKSSKLSHSEAEVDYQETRFKKKEEECKRHQKELNECKEENSSLKEKNRYLEGVQKTLESERDEMRAERDELRAANCKLLQRLKTLPPSSSNNAGGIVTSSQSHNYSQDQDTSSKHIVTSDHPVKKTHSEDKIVSSSAEHVTKKSSYDPRPWNNSDVRPSRSWAKYQPMTNEGKPVTNSNVFQERIQSKSDSSEEPRRNFQQNVVSRSGMARGVGDVQDRKLSRNPDIDFKRSQPYSSSSHERSAKSQQMHSKDVRDHDKFSYNPQQSRSFSSDCIKEINSDLFDMSSDYSLAHCVASDFLMSSGVAVQFRRKYKSTPELIEQNKKPGQVAFLERPGQYIYYLVSKVHSHEKPKWENFERSVIEWRSLCEEHGVKQIAIPRIGCGRDHLEWNRVKRLLDHQFSRTGIEVTVCNIEEENTSEKKPSLKLIHSKKPVSELDPTQCALVFIASCDHVVTESLSKLATKFGFSSDYVKNQYSLGTLYHYRNKAVDANVCGLVAKERHTDPISFRALSRCLQDLKRVMKKSDLWYIGFEAFDDPQFENVTKKTWSVLFDAFCYEDFEVHCCWPDYVKESCWEER